MCTAPVSVRYSSTREDSIWKHSQVGWCLDTVRKLPLKVFDHPYAIALPQIVVNIEGIRPNPRAGRSKRADKRRLDRRFNRRLVVEVIN